MIKIENTEVFGWKMAIAGCRNPMNSRAKSDSIFDIRFDAERDVRPLGYTINNEEKEVEDLTDFYIGPNDHKLLMNLCKGGTEEAKWRRMVHIQMDVTAPLYWWKEFETYKVGTVSNSCSTMHKIQAKEFTLEDFSCEHLNFFSKNALDVSIKQLNWCRETFNTPDDQLDMDILKKLGCETKKDLWYQMIQLLPSSYNQKRTIDLNYEVLAAQYRQRKDHKLDCWHQYCDWIRSLPYSEFITMEKT